jgi:two-component system, response regulator
MNAPIEILLVEDNPNDVELTLNAFARQKLDTRFHVASDGAEALDYVFGRGAHHGRDITQRPKLILLDLKLPKVNGLEVLREIKTDPRTKVIPVLILTSSNVERDIAAGYELGANGYIIKPVNFDQFLLMVNSVGTYWLRFNQNPVSPTAKVTQPDCRSTETKPAAV